MDLKSKLIEWWQEEYGFFGEHYLEGDNSKFGYLEKRRQNLKQRTETEVNGIIRLLDLKPNQSLLDIPCGYGRHSIGLAKLGTKVLGLDINNIHLAKAKNDAGSGLPNLKFEIGDMARIGYKEEFDALINMFYSFGFFKTDAENFKVLQNFYKALKPGGKFLFHTDVNIPGIIEGIYKQDEERILESGNSLRVIDKYDPKTKRINGSWTILTQDGSQTIKSYSVRVYDKDEFISLCHKAGFKSCLAYSDWDASLYSANSEDMIIVAIR